MFAKHPQIAERWAKETPDMKGLPEHKPFVAPPKKKKHETNKGHRHPRARGRGNPADLKKLLKGAMPTPAGIKRANVEK